MAGHGLFQTAELAASLVGFKANYSVYDFLIPFHGLTQTIDFKNKILEFLSEKWDILKESVVTMRPKA
ncbi:MAG: hypothetical protein V1689_12800 [Pseudomonadota bacterium]